MKISLKILHVIIIFLISNLIFGQADTLWTKIYGGEFVDGGNSITKLSNGEFILTGFTSIDPGESSNDMWLVKINSDGDTLWSSTIGESEKDEGHEVIEALDDGYIIVGESFANLIKTDNNGTVEWTKNFSGRFYSIDKVNDIRYVLVRTSNNYNQIKLIKTNLDGDVILEHSYELGEGACVAKSVEKTTDDGFIITGHIIENDNASIFLIKTDSEGEIIWTKVYGEIDQAEYAHTVRKTSDGGYIIAGHRTFDADHYDVCLIKTDTDGELIWSNSFGEDGIDEYGFDMQKTTDGGFVFGISKDVVIPPQTAARGPLYISSLCVRPGSLKWT